MANIPNNIVAILGVDNAGAITNIDPTLVFNKQVTASAVSVPKASTVTATQPTNVTQNTVTNVIENTVALVINASLGNIPMVNSSQDNFDESVVWQSAKKVGFNTRNPRWLIDANGGSINITPALITDGYKINNINFAYGDFSILGSEQIVVGDDLLLPIVNISNLILRGTIPVSPTGEDRILFVNDLGVVSAKTDIFLESMNGLTNKIQVFAFGSTGTTPNVVSTVVSTVGTHTFNFPLASATGVTAGLISKADYDTFTSRISGSGTINYLPKFTASTAVGNSLIFDNGTGVGISTTTITEKFNVSGYVLATGYKIFSGTVSQFLMANGTVSTITSLSLITGTGTLNYLPKFSASATLTDSLIYDNGTNVTVGGTTGSGRFNVVGTSVFYGNIVVDNSSNLSIAQSNSINTPAVGYSVFDVTNYNFDFLASTGGANYRWFRFDTSNLVNQALTIFTLPASSGTLALLTDIPSLAGYTPNTRTLTINGTTYDLSANRTWSVGTVTSVAAITLTSFVDTDISSTIATGTTTPVITLNIPTASYSDRGALSAADWVTFNSKEPAITAGTTSQYWRGDKSFQTLNTNVVAEGINLYFTTGRVRATDLTGLNIVGGSISTADTILTAFGKIQNQLNTLSGSVIYQGVWNANTNIPTLSSGVGTKGFYYKVSVAGSTTIDGVSEWKVGDWLIYNGTVWDKIDNTDSVSSVNGYTGAVSLTTSDITEGTRLYYTDARARSSVSVTTPLGYNNTTGLFSISQSNTTTDGFLSSIDWNTFNNKQVALSGTGFVKISGTTISYDNSTYYLASNPNNYIDLSSLTANAPLSYNNITGVFSITQSNTTTDGFLSSTDWNTFNNKESAITDGTTAQYWRGDKSWQTLNTTAVAEGTNLYYTEARVSANSNVSANTAARHNAVTIGTANGLSLSTQVLSLGLASTSANGALSSTDWNTFNNKQSALTNPITGTGTINYHPKFTGTNSLGNSLIYDNGTNVGINTTSASGTLEVNGTSRFVSNVAIGGSISSIINLIVSKTITGGATSFGIYQSGSVQSTVTTGIGIYNAINTQATAFTLSAYRHFQADNGTLGAGSAVSIQIGFFAQNLFQGTENYGFYGNLASGSGKWNIFMAGTASNYLAGNLGIGTNTLTGYSLRITKTITGAVSSFGVAQTGVVQSDVTTAAHGFYNSISTQATSFTLSVYRHFYADNGSIGAGSTVNNQYGFIVNDLSGATANYGFFGALSAGTNKWNLYMNGTANNYLAGSLLIGTTTNAGFKLDVTGTARITGNLTAASFIRSGGTSAQYLMADGSVSTLTDALVTGKLLTGYTTLTGTVSATDTILQAFGRLQAQLNALSGSLIYKGSWNASTNSPTIVSGTGTNGNYYIVSVAGTTTIDGISSWAIGDWIVFNSTTGTWQKIANQSVTSVNGFTGAVTITTSNIAEGANLYYTNARAIAATLTGYTSGAGTITSADTILSAIQKLNGNFSLVSSIFTGTSAQFVKANGTTSEIVTDLDSDITGTRDSSNTLFTISANFVANSTRVFVNGVRMQRGITNDYTEVGTNQIQFVVPPDSGDIIIVDYIK